MINVDFASPSLVLGITLIGCGIALLQVGYVQHLLEHNSSCSSWCHGIEQMATTRCVSPLCARRTQLCSLAPF
jgi:hypothetical protein